MEKKYNSTTWDSGVRTMMLWDLAAEGLRFVKTKKKSFRLKAKKTKKKEYNHYNSSAFRSDEMSNERWIEVKTAVESLVTRYKGFRLKVKKR